MTAVVLAAVSNNVYIALAWIVTFGAVLAYAVWVVRRGRALSREVPAEQRRWMTDERRTHG